MSNIEKRGDGRTVLLKRVRLSFSESLYEKKRVSDDPDAKARHSLNIILDHDQPSYDDNRASVTRAIRKACEVQWKNPDAWKDIQEDAPKRICYRKGARFKDKEGELYYGYEGNMAISASGPGGGQKRPKLLDRHKRPVDTEDILDVFYSGVYCDVVIAFFGTDKGSRGVFASVEAIRSHQDGERLGGGGVPVENDDFDDLDDDDSFGSSDNEDLLG